MTDNDPIAPLTLRGADGRVYSVAELLAAVATGDSWHEVLVDHPGLTPDDIKAGVLYAADAVALADLERRAAVARPLTDRGSQLATIVKEEAARLLATKPPPGGMTRMVAEAMLGVVRRVSREGVFDGVEHVPTDCPAVTDDWVTADVAWAVTLPGATAHDRGAWFGPAASPVAAVGMHYEGEVTVRRDVGGYVPLAWNATRGEFRALLRALRVPGVTP